VRMIFQSGSGSFSRAEAPSACRTPPPTIATGAPPSACRRTSPGPAPANSLCPNASPPAVPRPAGPPRACWGLSAATEDRSPRTDRAHGRAAKGNGTRTASTTPCGRRGRRCSAGCSGAGRGGGPGRGPAGRGPAARWRLRWRQSGRAILGRGARESIQRSMLLPRRPFKTASIKLRTESLVEAVGEMRYRLLCPASLGEAAAQAHVNDN
jgi:hypothetical protein